MQFINLTLRNKLTISLKCATWSGGATKLEKGDYKVLVHWVS
jgi:hypothetical protein